MTVTTLAAKPTLSVTEKATFDLPAAEVWAIISNFGRVEDWHPAVAKTEIRQGVNNVPGVVRRLTFLDQGTLEEKLTSYEPQHFRLQYVITAGAFPVSNYSTTLSVKPGRTADTSEVTWAGTFSRADLSASPAPGKGDQAAIDAVTGVYTTGLHSLKEVVADQKAITHVIGLYGDGGTLGDSGTVAKAFHPSATMKFVRDAKLVDEPISAYLENYIKPGVVQDRKVYIDSISIKGTAASARLTLDYPTHQFIDYFNLLKIDDQWLIVSKIFSRVSKPAT